MVMLLSELAECPLRLGAVPTRVVGWLVDGGGARVWGAELAPRRGRRRFVRWKQMTWGPGVVVASGVTADADGADPFPWRAPVLGPGREPVGTLADAEVAESGRIVLVHVSAGLIRDLTRGRRRIPVHWRDGRGLRAPLRVGRGGLEPWSR